MRKLLALLLLLLPLLASAQSDTSYFTRTFSRTDRAHAYSYAVPAKPEDGGYRLSVQFMDGGVMLTGLNRTDSYSMFDGYFTYYYEDGQRSSYGNYHNGRKVGQWTHRYRGLDKVWYVEAFNFKSDTTLIITSFYRSGKVRRKEYRTSDTTSGVCFKEDGTEIPFKPILVPPKEKIEGGVEAFVEHNIKYPLLSAKKQVAGKVIVEFMLTYNAHIEDISADFSDIAFAKEVVLAVKNMGYVWTPATIDGEPIDYVVTLPINFIQSLNTSSLRGYR